MPTYLTIPDDAYAAAAKAVADIRLATGQSADPRTIEKEIRSYVDLGIHKQIVDWSYSLSDDDKDGIATAVMNRTQQLFAVRPALDRVWVDLNSLETQAARGFASARIAYPRRSQETFEEQQTQGFQAPTVGTAVQNTIADMFGGLRSGAQAALKGLGIDIPVEIFLVIVAVVVIFLFRTLKA